MSFLKRLSRGTRANSYLEDYPESPRDREKHTFHDSPQQDQSQHNIIRGQPTSPEVGYDDKDPDGMYRNQGAVDSYSPQQQPFPLQKPRLNTGTGTQNRVPPMPLDSAPVSAKSDGASDLILRALDETIRPHKERAEQLEAQLADLQSYIDSLEQQRSEIYNWIDKRGLRPGESTFSSYSFVSCNAGSIANTLSQMSLQPSQVTWTRNRMPQEL